METDWVEQLSLFSWPKIMQSKENQIPHAYHCTEVNIFSSQTAPGISHFQKLPENYTFNYLFNKDQVSHKNQSKRIKAVSDLVQKNKFSIPQAWPYFQQASIASTGLLQSPKNANIPSAICQLQINNSGQVEILLLFFLFFLFFLFVFVEHT